MDSDAPSSEEARVLWLLREHDGRMLQSEIDAATEWSTAKVSEVLSEMAAGGRIHKLRLGRANLISLPECVPDHVED